MKIARRIISAILVVTILFSICYMEPVFAIEKNDDKFTEELTRMIDTYDTSFFTFQGSTTDPYETNRLIVKTSSDLSDYQNAVQSVHNPDQNVYILQYTSSEMKNVALDYYSNLANVEYVEED